MAKYLSGRSKKTPQSKLPADRYKYLSVGDAEPNFGDPVAPGDSVPVGQQYQIVSIEGFPGERYWVPIGGGLIPGSITVFDENSLVGGINSTTQLNFTGAAITAFGINSPEPGIAVTIKVFAPGNNQEILFNTSNDFSTSSKLKFDSSLGLLSAGDRINVGIGGTVITTTGVGSVGIGTTNPTQELHVQGDLRLTGTIYDYLNRPGNEGEVLVKTNNTFNGLSWTNQSTIRSGAGGTYTNIQYHGSTGLVEGASNFVFDNINSRIGIGSTAPNYLLDVVGYSSFKGQTDIDNLRVGVATVGTLGVTGLTTTQNLIVTGVATIGTLDVTGLAKTKDLNVTGIATIGTLGVTGLTTTKDLNVTGVATIGTLGVTGLTTTKDLNVTGVATVGTLGVTGLTTTQNLRVSGITTVGFLTGTDAFYSGIVTAQKFDGKIVTLEQSIETKSINVTGIGTIATLGVTTFTVSGLTSTKNLYVTDFATINNLTVTGVSTLGNVEIANNQISTKSGSGNLTIDSDGGTTVIKDSVSIEDTTQSTNKDTGALVVDGGVGIEKNLNVGGNVGLGTSSSNTVSFTSRVSSNILPSTSNLNLGSSSNRWGTVFADKFDGTVVGVADTANTVGVGTTTGTGNYFLTFVDSNNPASSRTGELLYSDAGIVYNPSTNVLSVDGIIESRNDNYSFATNEGGQFVLRGKSGTPFRWNIDNYTNSGNTVVNLFRIFKEDDVDGGNGSTYLGITTIGEVLVGTDVYLPTGTSNQKLQVSGGAYVSGNVGIGTINPGEKLQVDGNIRVGGSNTSNYIAFRGTINDDQIPYTNAYIGERIYQTGTERSELVLYKGNDLNPGSGYDRIRLIGSELRFDTYTSSIDNPGAFPIGTFEEVCSSSLVTNKMILTYDGNLGIGTINPQSRLGVAGTITPSESSKFDLGTSNLKWDNIYANKFNGTFVGIADSAKQLQTARNIEITGDLTWNVNFDGSANVSSTGTLANSGVTAGIYGSSTQVGIVTVDSKGRITAASNVNINFSSASVARASYADTAGIATNATNLKGGSASQIPYQSAPDTTAFIPNGTSGQLLQSNGTSAPSWVTPSGLNVGIASSASQVNVVTDNTNTTRYIPFVSGTTGVSSIFADSGITYNPSTDSFNVTGLSSANTLMSRGWDFILGNGDQITRGDSGVSRALVKLVKDGNSVLGLNYATDFLGGTSLFSNLFPWNDDAYTLGTPDRYWKTLYVKSIVGSLTGSASSITVTSDNTNTTRYIPFVSGTTGVSSIFADNTLTYNPSTDTLQSSSIIVSKGVGDNSGTNSALRIVLPGGASYATTNSVVTGAIKITLPVYRTSTMMRMTVKIYEYSGGASGNSRTIELGGYNYFDGGWYNYFAYQTSMNGVTSKNVRFGYEDGNNVIWIGEVGDTWAYPQVYVTEFQGGYSSYDYSRWASGWNISFTTAFGTVEQGPISASVGSVTNINVEQINYGCSNPISVKTSSGITTIGIGTTSNAYGRKFIQSTEPTNVCDGDIWYDIGTTNIPKTYTFDAIDSGNNAILRLNDGTTNDDVLITAGTGITIDPVSAGGFTISAALSNSINGPFTLSTTPFFRNTSTITQNYTVESKDFNEMTIGPTTINNGVTVTVNVDASWIIL